MSKIIKTVGIVIAENAVSDSDKMLTILTSEYGKINAIAKQSRRLRSSLLSGTQFLCLSNFTLYKASSIFKVNEATPIEMFYEIYEDYDKLLLATNITKAINCVALENYFEHNLLKLFILTLQYISLNNKPEKTINKDKDEDENKNKSKSNTNGNGNSNDKTIKIIENNKENNKDILNNNFKSDVFIESVFKLRLLGQLGFKPELVELPKKDNEHHYEFVFDFEDNKVLIIDENIKIRNSIRIQKETLMALTYIFNSDLSKIYDFTVSNRILLELSKIADKYFDRCIY